MDLHPIWHNSTGQIGCKSIEIMTTKSQWISAQIDQHLSMDLHPIWHNLTSRIGCKSIEIMTTKSQWISTQIDQALITGQIG